MDNSRRSCARFRDHVRMASTSINRGRRAAFDPRLVIGILLVIVSVVGVVGLVAANDRSTSVYAARHTLSMGQRISADDLELRSVRLDSAVHLYLSAGEVPKDGLVLTRTVDEGELLPASATASTAAVTTTSIVVETGGIFAESVKPGAIVDVWAARDAGEGRFDAPAVIVPGATVVRLLESDSIVGAGKTVGIEVLVPQGRVARVLQAIANGDAISIVPGTIAGTVAAKG